MNKFHFGKSPASIALVEILDNPEYSKFKRYVSSIINKYNYIINEIDFSDLKFDVKFLTLLSIRKEFKRLLNEKPNLPILLKRYVFNIFTANYRQAIKNKKNRNNKCKNLYNGM